MLLKQWKWLAIFTIFIFCLSTGKVYAFNGHSNLSQEINLLLKKEPDLNGAIISISIRSKSNGQLIYQHQGDIRLRPASNLKLLTAAGALSILGKDYTSRTEILTNGKIKKGTVRGDLYIKGKGDPTLLLSDLDKLAEQVRRKGIKKIEGDLIGDDTWYDNVRYSKDLPWSDETTYYGSQISALTFSPNKEFDQGTIIIGLTPGDKPGKKAKLQVTPNTNYIHVTNKAVTVTADQKEKITIEREHAKNTIIIKGIIPIESQKLEERVAIWNPSLFTLGQFKQSLIKQGVKVEGTLKMRCIPNHSKIIAYHDSSPLSLRLIPFMKLSNNSHGEMLIKEIGKIKEGTGSWDNGLDVLKSELIKFGLNPDTMILRDGSGLSQVNLIPANQISQLLYAIQKEEWFPVYLNSLPVAGIKDKMIGGSLRNRLAKFQGKVIAKTGTISTVSSLSGYVKTKNGQDLIFSIIINNLLDEEKGKKIEDKIVTILANS